MNHEKPVADLLKTLEDLSPADLSRREELKADLLSAYDSIVGSTVPGEHADSRLSQMHPAQVSSSITYLADTWLERLFFTRPWRVLLPISFGITLLLRYTIGEHFLTVIGIILGFTKI